MWGITMPTDPLLLNDSVCRSFSSRCRRLFHSGPIFGMGLVIFLTLASLSVVISTFLPFRKIFATANAFFCVFLSFYILRSYALAAWLGPGFVKFGWQPIDPRDKAFLQFCTVCDGYKPPRSHHCHTCGRCVLKMDHHCPWINGCVGHLNHGYFLHFVLSAPIGCLYCCSLCSYRIYFVLTRSYALYRFGYDYRILFNFYEIAILLIALGLAFGVILAVGGLGYCQMKGILRNRTVIEDWIMTKASDRRGSESNPKPMVYPYDLGWKRNLLQVLSWRGNPVGDGYMWPLKPGCGTYDLTIEQLKQKNLKSKTAIPFRIERAYSGSMLAVSYGWRTCCCPPCSGENLMAVAVGHTVLVTRAHKGWYYGQLVSATEEGDGHSAKTPIKGWFPKACVSVAANRNRGKAKQS
ncbi:Palmitoyltransferase ZDHHC6 [Echinococcus granulosus]|uniref:Palmitoyltransferase n=1 Tax=Echinococcus granulosus TaxID=6210 RepID=A0A068WZ78_ECHGR|nr:Palmitoyltransferase ZDHHC6 [Echinococcus granulosus]CDS22991.1 zinc finger DHHC type containing 6 [Echinococcus granulosus]